MTLLLVGGLYAGMAIWGKPDAQAAIQPDRAAVRAAIQVAAAGPDYPRPVIIETSGPAVTRAANARTIVGPATRPDADAAAGSFGEPRTISLLQPNLATLTAPEDADVSVLLRVTGAGVNMRAGPSTSDPVVATLPEGAYAEPIGGALDGWQEIRLVATGQTGFMAARFLDPA